MNMEITEARAAQFDKLENQACVLLQEYLEGKRTGGDDIVTARCVLNVIRGNRQTTTARDALRYAMVSDLGDPKVRERYVKATEPEIKKLLKA
jgi:hypothetical protein